MGLQSLPTGAEHPPVQVDRTSKRDCGRRWVGWRRSILSSRAWWLGWRRRLLLDFLWKQGETLTSTDGFISGMIQYRYFIPRAILSE